MSTRILDWRLTTIFYSFCPKILRDAKANGLYLHCSNSGESFHSHLILVMGVNSKNNNILLQTPWWFGAINNIRDDKDITQSRGVHPQGVSSYAWIEFSKQALWYLNQISGPSFTCWDVYPSIEIVDGVEYHQCWLGPDQWSNRSKIFKELEANASLTNPQYDTWKKHDDHYIESCDDLIAQLCSSRKLSQFHGSRVCVTYSLLQQAYGKYMWMHMPSSTPCGQYFGLIT